MCEATLLWLQSQIDFDNEFTKTITGN